MLVLRVPQIVVISARVEKLCLNRVCGPRPDITEGRKTHQMYLSAQVGTERGEAK